jgi:hypothetical protein
MVGGRLRRAFSGRRRVLGALALALYALLLTVSPVLHHDLACHVKSPGHCDACVANAPASRAEPRAVLDAPVWRAAGEAPVSEQAREHRAALTPTSGRSPPA